MAESGWYADPTARHELRWFDGKQWTEHVTDQGVGGVDNPGDKRPLTPATAAEWVGDASDHSASTTQTVIPLGRPTMTASPPSAGDGSENDPTLLFVTGVGIVALVWSQLLVGVILNEPYWDRYGSSVAMYGALFVAGCGAAAAAAWPDGRRRILISGPMGAFLTYVAITASADSEYRVLAIGVGVGIAVGATLLSVGFGALASALTWVFGGLVGWGRWMTFVPIWLGGNERTYMGASDFLATLGPLLLGTLPAVGVYLSRRLQPDAPLTPWLSSGTGGEADDGPTVGGPVTVSAAPEDVAAFVVRELVGAGALVTAQSSTSISGHVLTKKKPSVLIAILLWFICIIPMVIYLVNGSKDSVEPFSLTFTSDPGGTRIEVGGVGRGLGAATWAASAAAARWAALAAPQREETQ